MNTTIRILAISSALVFGSLVHGQTATLTTASTNYDAAGGSITFTATITYPGLTPSALGWAVAIPTGWAYQSTVGGAAPDLQPVAGTTNVLEWAYYNAIPATTAQFTFTVGYPAGLTAPQTVTAEAYYRSPAQTLVVGALVIAPPPPGTPPEFAIEPTDQQVTFPHAAVFSASATGEPEPSYRWQMQATATDNWQDLSDNTMFVGTDEATLHVMSPPFSMTGGRFRCVATNGVLPDAESETAVLTVVRCPAVVTLANTVQLFDGSAKPIAVSTSPPGLPVTVSYDGSPQAPSAVGHYPVTASITDANYIGTATGQLVISPAVSTPTSTTPGAGGAFALSAAVSAGTVPTGYQWQFRRIPGGSINTLVDGDGWENIPGATNRTYEVPSAQTFHSGEYRVVITVAGGEIASEPTALSVQAPPPSNSRLLNLSTRALCRTGDDVLIPGFVIDGSGSKRLLIRAVGPTLGVDPFNIVGVLPNPQLTLKRRVNDAYQDYATNDDWGTNANADAIREAAARVFAFGLVEGSADAALLVDLPAGQYTAVASGLGTSNTGIAIVEFYDADEVRGAAKLVNLSNRGYVGLGDTIMIPGVIVSDEGSKTLLIRAVGPGLAPFGVGGLLADPKVTIFRGSDRILENDDWGVGADPGQTSSVGAQVFAFPLAAGSKDAAFVVTLPPGAYTVQATGVSDTTGVALVEVYQVP